MKILVTGAKGFVGRNLCENLKAVRDGKNRTRPALQIEDVFEYDLDTPPAELDHFCAEADFVFNVAGVNRPKNNDEFMQGNFLHLRAGDRRAGAGLPLPESVR